MQVGGRGAALGRGASEGGGGSRLARRAVQDRGDGLARGGAVDGAVQVDGGGRLRVERGRSGG